MCAISSLLTGSANGGNGGLEHGNGVDGGIAMEAGSQADGANGHNGGMALGPGSDADGGGIAEDGGHTHPGCSVAIGSQCY
jgi:hypothetical protein